MKYNKNQLRSIIREVIKEIAKPKYGDKSPSPFGPSMPEPYPQGASMPSPEEINQLRMEHCPNMVGKPVDFSNPLNEQADFALFPILGPIVRTGYLIYYICTEAFGPGTGGTPPPPESSTYGPDDEYHGKEGKGGEYGEYDPIGGPG